jgi:Secretion system C-terminal sorting domain/NHL repeat
MKKNLLLLAIIFCSITLMAQTVTKFNGGTYSPGANNTATYSTFALATYFGPQKIVFDQYGNGWVLEQAGNRIKMIDAAQTNVYCRAGSVSGAPGQQNKGGILASFDTPSDLVLDTLGNIYIADAGNNCIRKISPFINLGTQQTVTTYAGIMTYTVGSADGTLSSARFNSPAGLAIDRVGNIYVADAGNHCIRKITPSGNVTTIAGNSSTAGNNDGNGSVATFQAPTGLGWYINPDFKYVNGVLQTSHELLITDPLNNNIRLLDVNTNIVSTVAGIVGVSGNVDGDVSVATFGYPMEVSCDSSSNIYITDTSSNVIRKITGSCVSTFAGSIGISGSTNGNGTSAKFNSPMGVTLYKNALYIADFTNNTIRKVTVPGTPADKTPVANFSIQTDGNPNKTYSLIDSTSGTIFTGNQRWKITPGSFTYVGGTDSTSAIAQVQFKTMTQYTITLTDANCWGKNSKIATINISNTGVNEVNADKYISVYPNPTNGIFEVSINTIEANSIRVMDINGKTILDRKNVSSKENIDMTGFAKGVYILTISGTDFSLNKKLIIE